MTRAQKGVVGLILFELLTGFTPLFVKNINPLFPTSLLAFTRHFLAMLFFLGLIFLRKDDFKYFLQLRPKQILPLLLLGMCGSGITAVLYIYSLRTIGISLTSLIGSLEIPLGIIIAALFFKEKITKGFIYVACLILFSFFLVIFKPVHGISSDSLFLAGVLSILFSAVLWGLATNLGKLFVSKQIPVTIISFYRFSMGALAGLLIAVFSGADFAKAYGILDVIDWLSFFYLGFLSSGLGFILYYKSLRYIEVKKVSLFFTISTMVGVFLGVATGEILVFRQWIGALGVILGILLLLKEDKIAQHKALEEQIEN